MILLLPWTPKLAYCIRLRTEGHGWVLYRFYPKSRALKHESYWHVASLLQACIYFCRLSSSNQNNATNYYMCAMSLEIIKAPVVACSMYGFLLIKFLQDMEANSRLRFSNKRLDQIQEGLFLSGLEWWPLHWLLGLPVNDQEILWVPKKICNGHVACRPQHASCLSGWFGLSWGQWAVLF